MSLWSWLTGGPKPAVASAPADPHAAIEALVRRVAATSFPDALSRAQAQLGLGEALFAYAAGRDGEMAMQRLDEAVVCAHHALAGFAPGSADARRAQDLMAAAQSARARRLDGEAKAHALAEAEKARAARG